MTSTSTRTMNQQAINYVIRRRLEVMRQVDTHLAISGGISGESVKAPEPRATGTDVEPSMVGAYSVVYGTADGHSEAQIRYSISQASKHKYGGRHVFYGRLGDYTTYHPDGTVEHHRAGGHGGRRHNQTGRPVSNPTGATLSGADRTYLSKARCKARQENPDATDDQVEAVAYAALEAKWDRAAKRKADKAAQGKAHVAAKAMAASGGSWADGE